MISLAPRLDKEYFLIFILMITIINYWTNLSVSSIEESRTLTLNPYVLAIKKPALNNVRAGF